MFGRGSIFFTCFVLTIQIIHYTYGGFNAGSGVMLTVPPMGSVAPIHGKLWGLPGPLSQYVAIVLNNGNCNIWWDKGHNMNRGLNINSAAIPIDDNGDFVLYNWDASPYDALSVRFASFIFDKQYILTWPEYVAENFIIHDAIFEGSWSWTFIDRTGCTDPNAPCEGVTWVPNRPPVTPTPRPLGVQIQPDICDKPPQLPVGLPCPGCVDIDGQAPPGIPIPRNELIALSDQGGLPPLPSASNSPSSSPSPSPSASVSPSSVLSIVEGFGDVTVSPATGTIDPYTMETNSANTQFSLSSIYSNIFFQIIIIGITVFYVYTW